MLDEITINGILYRRVEDKTEDRPINFNPFDVSEDNGQVWVLPIGIDHITSIKECFYNPTSYRMKDLIDKEVLVADDQVALSVDFRCRIMRKLLQYGYDNNCLWNGEGEAYTIGYSVCPYGVDFMVIPWKNMSDICSIAFNSQDECNDAIDIIVRPEYMVAQRDNDKLYKKEEWI